MERRILQAIGVCALVATFSMTAAEAKAGRVNAREHDQRQRIHAGVQDGSLTHREGCHLRHQQLRTEQLEHRMRADGGGLGPHERARLDHRLDRDSASIYRQRHDGQTR